MAYRLARSGRGLGDEVELARVIGRIDPGHFSSSTRAEDLWEGALLAQVPPGKLAAVIANGEWPQLHTLAGLAGDDPDSQVVAYNRTAWREWQVPGWDPE